MKPVDVRPFLEDETVQEIIASTAAVRVDDQTGDGLKGRDRRIEGLKSDKYYMVEKETDANGIEVTANYPKFVTEYAQLTPGQLIGDLGFITRISGGRIIGLTNYNTYTVRAATAFSNDTSFTYTDSAGASNQSISVSNGAITIPGSAGSLTLEQLNTQYDGYEVMAVPVTPPLLPETSDFADYYTVAINTRVTSFKLEAPDTEVDYVFFRKTPLDFKVLRVKIEAIGEVKTVDIFTIEGVTPPVAGEIPVTAITETAQYTGSVEWDNGNPGIFAAATVYTATITLTPASGYTLTGVTANFFQVSGATSVSNAANSGIITAVFPSTAATITDPAVIPGVTPPVTRVAPVRNLDATQYTGTISWSPTVANGETFAAETVYTATIILTPKTGYTLYGIAANFFTVAGASSVTGNTANNGVVTVTFPKTDPAASGINITLTFVLPTDASISGPAGPVSYNDVADGTTSLTFTLDDGDFSGVTWNLDGVSLGSGGSVTINSSTPNLDSLLVDGPHRLNASGTRDGESWGAFVQFVISN